jgi:recombination protein RecA
MADLSFLKGFEKDLTDLGLDEGSSEPPRYWFSTGNYVMNKTLSGSFLKGIPQGRVTGLTGPSSSGKSFLLCNIMREAQKAGAFVVAIDSENALDNDFVSKIGVDPDNNYKYVDVDTIPQCIKVVSSFLKSYKATYEKDDEDAPKVLIVIDSLNMLSTETEAENFEKGVSKGDQGQTNKQLKQMLKSFVRTIKHLNVSIVVTSHVYANQNVLNGEGVWIVADAVKFALSQIALLTKLKMRQGEGAKREVTGVEIKVEGYKTRFTKPFQTAKLEVPYDTGMDPFNGLFEVALELGIITKKGSWYVIGDSDNFRQDDFYKPDFANTRADILVKCEASSTKFIEARLEDMEEDIEDEPSAKSKRLKKAKGE